MRINKKSAGASLRLQTLHRRWKDKISSHIRKMNVLRMIRSTLRKSAGVVRRVGKQTRSVLGMSKRRKSRKSRSSRSRSTRRR